MSDVCDICGQRFYAECGYCGRTICVEHTSQGGRHVSCSSCWKIGEPYRKRIELIVGTADAEVRSQEIEWKDECKRRLEAKEKDDAAMDALIVKAHRFPEAKA